MGSIAEKVVPRQEELKKLGQKDVEQYAQYIDPE